jgi:spermidine dehydrogenase
MTDPRDRELGMDRRITRRDFLNGVAVAAGAALGGLGAGLDPGFAGSQMDPDPYPPALTGLRGSHPGSFESLHAVVDRSFWARAGAPLPAGETFDLVVVGAGISGLAAAWFYRAAAGGSARILVLDNHDDFGGHAKRNEFTFRGRTWIGYGGTQSIDSPAPYSAVAKGLISELGIDVSRYAQAVDERLYSSLGLRPAFFFDRETFGADRLVIGSPSRPTDAFLARAPIADAVRRDLRRLVSETRDALPGLTSAEKKARLARMSYASFLTDVWKLDRGVLPLFQTRTHSLFGVGIDAVPAQDAWGLGFPGFEGMGLDEARGPGQNLDSIRYPDAEEYYFHFPDGNATIARLLVRRLVPGSIPGRTATDIVTARARYAELDRPGAAVRIRLRSTVVRVQHGGAAAGDRGLVEIDYERGGRLESVRARHAILACWHSVIPYICPELPGPQKEALAFGVKVPLVYTNVFIRRWRAFTKLGIRSVESPGLWHTSLGLDVPVSLGAYRAPRSPDEPIVLHLSKTPCQPGLPVRMQHRAGRLELLTTPFETIERSIRRQLARILGAGGFDPGRDVLAITVNRWPHGYAYQYNSLFDDFWLAGQEPPCAVARRPFGRIAIANADSAAYAYTDAAIDHAHRAAGELVTGRG